MPRLGCKEAHTAILIPNRHDSSCQACGSCSHLQLTYDLLLLNSGPDPKVRIKRHHYDILPLSVDMGDFQTRHFENSM